MKHLIKKRQKTWKDIDIYFIGYIDKKPDWNVNSVNPLYLIINRVYGYVSEKNGVRFLKIDKRDSVLKIDKKNYPQVYLEQCKYKVKKREIKSFNDYEIDLDSDYESD